MGKNVAKTPTFGGSGLFDGLEPANTDAPTYTHTHTHKHTPTPVNTMETKSRRVNLLLKPSTVDGLDAYVEAQKAKGVRTSKNDVIQTLVDKFLEENA